MRTTFFLGCIAVLGWLSFPAQAQLPVTGPEAEPDNAEEPPQPGTSPTNEEVFADAAGGGGLKLPLRGETFRRKYHLLIAGSQLHLLDFAGTKLDSTYFPSDIIDAVLGMERIYVATRTHGIYILKVNWNSRFEKVGHVASEGTPSRIYYDHPYLFVVYPQYKSALYQLSASGVQRVRDGQWHRVEFASVQESREKASGRVLRIRGGEVTINLGQKQGFKPGDRVRVLSRGRSLEYNPIGGEKRLDSRLKLRAVLVLDEVREEESIARLERGVDVRAGDIVQYFGEEKTPDVERILRWGGTSRIVANVLPGFLVGDPMLGLQLRFEHQFAFPLTLGAGLRTFAGGDASGTGFSLDAAYDTDYFAIGYQVDFLKPSGEEEGSIPLLATSGMFLRLGTLDGLHLLFNYRSNFRELYGLSGRVQFSGVRHNLYASWDFTFGTYKVVKENWDEDERDMSFGAFLVGDRIRLWGNGGADTMFANVYLGIQTVNLDQDENTSFVMGGGVEYRF